MYKYIKSAESDFIKIGNVILPKNASQYGYDSYENIVKDATRRYNAEKDAERKAAEDTAKAAEVEKLKQAAQPIYQKCKEAVESAQSTDDKLEALFDILVPSSGPAETLAGELVRAMMRLEYRYYNDGDYFYTGYGLETCGSSAAFIADKTDNKIYSLILDTAENMDQDSEYKQSLDKIANSVIYYVMNNSKTFWTKSEDSRDYTSGTLTEFEELSRNMEYEVDTSGDLEEYINNGCISWRDFEYWLQELSDRYGGSVSNWAQNGFTIVDLNQEEYDEWEDMYDKELQSYLEDLEEEYPNFGVEEEDY